jgi:hypothetical protein
LCCLLQWFWFPVDHFSNGDTQSCCIIIGDVNVVMEWMKCMEDIAPTSWRVIYLLMQPYGPNDVSCYLDRNWTHCCMAIQTSLRQIKWKFWSMFPFTLMWS